MMDVHFYIDGVAYAIRTLDNIPIVGDEVKFKGVVYRVERRVFIFDEKKERVGIDMLMIEDKDS